MKEKLSPIKPDGSNYPLNLPHPKELTLEQIYYLKTYMVRVIEWLDMTVKCSSEPPQ